ncbi:MAG: glycosyl transferase [Candidatus Tokpelaia sp. JSC161]|jgi:glycosyl transferase family 25|nr:MAG: glycosyl transferase [Candidatus Tokpelaia sp. JSC161]
MKLYVINLDLYPERFFRLNEIFAQQGLTPRRIRALDMKNISDTDYKNLTRKSFWPERMTRGEIACFLSHRTALQQLAEEQEAYGAVFEDDVILSNNAHLFLKNYFWIPSGVDLVKLETQGKKVWLGHSIKNVNNFSLGRLKSSHILAAAYIVSKKSALYLIKKMEDVCAPFDHFLFNLDYGIANKLKIYQLDPAIARQSNVRSTLEYERAQYRDERKKKRTMMGILQREFCRLGRRSYIGLRGIKINCFSEDKWKKIDFDSNPG